MPLLNELLLAMHHNAHAAVDPPPAPDVPYPPLSHMLARGHARPGYHTSKTSSAAEVALAAARSRAAQVREVRTAQRPSLEGFRPDYETCAEALTLPTPPALALRMRQVAILHGLLGGVTDDSVRLLHDALAVQLSRVCSAALHQASFRRALTRGRPRAAPVTKEGRLEAAAMGESAEPAETATAPRRARRPAKRPSKAPSSPPSAAASGGKQAARLPRGAFRVPKPRELLRQPEQVQPGDIRTALELDPRLLQGELRDVVMQRLSFSGGL